MLKLIGMILVIGSFSGIGIAQRQQYLGRVRTLQDLLSALDIISGELSYRLSSIPDIVSILAADSRESVSQVFSHMKELISKENGLSLAYKWMKTFQEYGPEVSLQEEDIKIFCDLSDFIGKYDVKSQEKCIEFARTRLQDQLTLAQAELKNKGTVYRTCCIAAGVLLVLVLI